MKKSLIAVLISSVLAVQSPTTIAADASLGLQIVQQATLIQQYASQAEMLKQDIGMLQDAYKNSTGLPLQAWGSAISHINGVIDLLRDAQGISYASDNVMGQIYDQYGDADTYHQDYSAKVGTWNSNMMSQVGSVLGSYNRQVNTMNDTQNAMRSIINASQNATGRMQVLQAGNQLAGIAVNEMQNLQSIVMAGNQAQLNYIATQTAKEEQERKRSERFFQKAKGNY